MDKFSKKRRSRYRKKQSRLRRKGGMKNSENKNGVQEGGLPILAVPVAIKIAIKTAKEIYNTYKKAHADKLVHTSNGSQTPAPPEKRKEKE